MRIFSYGLCLGMAVGLGHSNHVLLCHPKVEKDLILLKVKKLWNLRQFPNFGKKVTSVTSAGDFSDLLTSTLILSSVGL